MSVVQHGIPLHVLSSKCISCQTSPEFFGELYIKALLQWSFLSTRLYHKV